MGTARSEQINESQYSNEKLYLIVSKVKLDKKFGSIEYSLDVGGSTFLSIWAPPKINPHFINKIDEKIWEEQWNNRSSSFGIKYYTEKDSNFEEWSSNFKKDITVVDYSKVSDFVEKGIELLKAHYEATIRYNTERTEPLIKERTSLIEKIITGK